MNIYGSFIFSLLGCEPHRSGFPKTWHQFFLPFFSVQWNGKMCVRWDVYSSVISTILINLVPREKAPPNFNSTAKIRVIIFLSTQLILPRTFSLGFRSFFKLNFFLWWLIQWSSKNRYSLVFVFCGRYRTVLTVYSNKMCPQFNSFQN